MVTLRSFKCACVLRQSWLGLKDLQQSLKAEMPTISTFNARGALDMETFMEQNRTHTRVSPDLFTPQEVQFRDQGPQNAGICPSDIRRLLSLPPPTTLQQANLSASRRATPLEP